MTLPAWNLDAQAETAPPTAGSHPGLVMVLAIGLVGLGLGAWAGSVLIPAGAPRPPVTATLNIRDLYVDMSQPTPPTGPSAEAGPGPPVLIGDPVIVFRLQVDNTGTQMVRVTRLELDGVTRNSDLLPLNLRVAGRGSAAADITLHPDCAADREPASVRAGLRITDADGSDPLVVRIAPSRTLSRFGGLCSQLDTELPNGWRTPLQANSTRLTGADLEIVMDDLSTARLAGILVDDGLLPTVFVGDQLLSTTAQLRSGEETRLRLRGPSPCIQFSDSAPIPSTLRLLAEGDGGLQQRLVVVGPALSRWLRRDCATGPAGPTDGG